MDLWPRAARFFVRFPPRSRLIPNVQIISAKVLTVVPAAVVGDSFTRKRIVMRNFFGSLPG